MSSWNPPPEGSGGWPGDPGQGYGQPVAPGEGSGQPGAPGQGYGPSAGPGVPAPQWYGVPGMGGYQPPNRRRRIFRRLGIGGAVIIAAIIVASVLVYQHDNHAWKLTAPGTAAGLPRSTNPLDTLGLSDAVTSARSAIAKVPGYGTIKSSASAAYQSGSGPLVWFIGFNG